MRLWLRRFIILLIAFVFATGGIGRSALALAPDEPCHTDHVAAEHSAHVHGAHDSGAMQQKDEGKQGHAADNACFKCCGVCTAAPSLNDANAPTNAVRVAFAVSYVAPILTFTDRPLAIDPGIPKRMA